MAKRLVYALLLSCLLVPTVQAEPEAGAEWTEPETGMEFVWVPAGCFQMGGTDWNYEAPIHKVCVKGFWMGKYEVTQAQYLQVTGGNPSRYNFAKNPVDNVSWDDVQNFNARMKDVTGTGVRLPSEAEWEYACRAGHDGGKYCGNGDNPNVLAWYNANSDHKPRPVGRLQENDWGLHDMSGNLWEWVQDCWHENFEGAPEDGSVWQGGQCPMRVLRGGSWCNDSNYARAAFRYGNDPDGGECSGFRVVKSAP